MTENVNYISVFASKHPILAILQLFRFFTKISVSACVEKREQTEYLVVIGKKFTIDLVILHKNETFENLTVKQIITIIALVTVDNNIKGKFQTNFQ